MEGKCWLHQGERLLDHAACRHVIDERRPAVRYIRPGRASIRALIICADCYERYSASDKGTRFNYSTDPMDDLLSCICAECADLLVMPGLVN